MAFDIARLMDLGEYYAAGFCEAPERSRFYRYALAQTRYYEHVSLPEYDGGALYPCGRLWLGRTSAPGEGTAAEQAAVIPSYSFTFTMDEARLRAKDAQCAEVFRRESALSPGISGPHTVGGNLYTHSIPNYGRVLREGLNGHRRRIEALPEGDFRDGLLVLLSGIDALRLRAVAQLRSAGAPAQLPDALERVPFQPARSLYEALVCWNFLYYVDGCDNPGHLDMELREFYRGEDATEWLREFFRHVDANDGWSGALGPEYHPLTVQCLRAIRGIRRPSLELRITREMPEAVWQAAVDALVTGCGQPSLYSEENYQKALAQRFPEIPQEDRLQFHGGGCTETMLAGCSNVGSLDAGINLPLVFAQVMRDALPACPDFDSFYTQVIARCGETVQSVLSQVNEARKLRAKYRPQPVRTLLIDDCIDRERDFNDGGARYAWSVVNLAGLVNVIESLLMIRYAVYEEKLLSAGELLSALDRDDAIIGQARKNAPHYGVDDPRADQLAQDFTHGVLDAFEGIPCYPSGKFLPAIIQFTTYVDAGKAVPATPDGRQAGTPLNDSVGALKGMDTKGPTALLCSTSSLPLWRMAGTPVMNLRLSKAHIRDTLKPLTMIFFDRGGMQLQITCQSRSDMEAAMQNPQDYGHLIVRIGGYSEYFVRLSPELQRTVLDRTEH